MQHQVRTACTRDCGDACQIIATVEDGKVTSLCGDPAHPVTRGYLCYRTDHFLERQYSSERLLRPLIKKNGVLEEASWEEALDLVASMLAWAKREHGETSIFHYQSGGSLGLVKMLNRHFFEHLGKVTHKRGDICSGAGEAAQSSDMGKVDAHDLEDLKNSQAIVLWGKNVAETGVHLIPHLKAARAGGVPVIGVDPVFGAKTAALTDRMISVRPSADGFLVLAILRLLFDRGLVTEEALARCDHVEDFRALVHRRTSSAWAKIAEVSAEDVDLLARLFGERKPACLFVGWGLGRRIHGSKSIRLLDALSAVTGNLGVPGGGASYYFQRRSGFDQSWIKLPENAGARTLLEPLLGKEILEADPKIRVAVVDNANPVSQLPDSTTVARAFRSIDFLVVLDAFLTDTAELADVVLPTSTMLEENDVVGAYGHHHIQMSQPVVPPPPGVRSDLQIYQALADRLGFGEKMAGDAGSFIDKLLAPMKDHGVTREALARSSLRKPAAPKVMFPDGKYQTPSGRFQLITDFPLEPPRLEQGYPLHLMSISSYKQQASQISRKEQMDALPVVTLHPEAAEGRSNGTEAWLVSPIARSRVVLKFDDKLRRDIVVFPKGRWGSLGGPNLLVRARETDGGGGAAYYDQGVRLE